MKVDLGVLVHALQGNGQPWGWRVVQWDILNISL